jgi:MoaA/NifB/PqqE/SkfB family radical SAM enzyme
MLSPSILHEYNLTRKTHDTSVVCHAPFSAINFEQNGNATACCYNRQHVLGTYPQHTIKEMWTGKAAKKLREYIRNNDLSGGCKLCAAQLNAKNFSGVHAKLFDAYVDKTKKFEYPKILEFEISNTCNLECTMCSGYYSSSIRKNREQAEELISPYDDKFVQQLEEFIPHLTDARFLGGEPFLINIYYDIWERIAQLNPEMTIHITTNGTILNNKAKQLLEKMRCNINLSIDSMDPENYARIRKNGKLEKVMENFRYFKEYTASKNTYLTFAVCPMTDNWKDLPDILEFCNSERVGLYFSTVIYPVEVSLRSLTIEKLNEVIEYLESKLPAFTVFPNSTQNVKNYKGLINQLRQWAVQGEARFTSV